MSNQGRNSFDVVIIGAGISGLVCGCYLAKAGMKVLVAEHHDRPGGYFTSFKRGLFLFDAAAHSFGNYRKGGHVHKIFSDLEVDRLLSIKRHDPSDVIITPDFTAKFSNDTAQTVTGLAEIFPAEKNNLLRLFDFLTSSSPAHFMQLKGKSFGYLLRSFLHDERLISALSLPVLGNGGLPPSSMNAFSGAKIFSEFIIDGGYYPEGGIQKIPDALATIITKNNGVVLYKKTIRKILRKNDAVAGVESNSGEKFFSKYVVSACDMIQTYTNLFGEQVDDVQELRNLSKMIPSISTFILYIGLKDIFSGLPQPGTNTWHLPHYDLEEIYNQILMCSFDKGNIFMFRVSPDQKTMLSLVSAPFKTRSYWKENKKRTANEFLDRIENLIPGLRKHIAYFDAATPVTLSRFTLNHKGAAFGWEKSLEQAYDPIFNRKSFFPGLYLSGHWTSMAFGMPGACYTGADTAARILRREKVTIP